MSFKPFLKLGQKTSPLAPRVEGSVICRPDYSGHADIRHQEAIEKSQPLKNLTEF
jgi:hypothetical protein